MQNQPATNQPAPRIDLIRRIRQEIASGTYDTPGRFAKLAENLGQALERQDPDEDLPVLRRGRRRPR